MDSTGVPQKINRHIIKALTHNALEGLKFIEVLEYVRICNRNLKPVANLTQTVHKALENCQRIGLIVKNDKARYRISDFAIFKQNEGIGTSCRTLSAECSRNAAQRRSLVHNSRKRASCASIAGDDVVSAPKRLRLQKNSANRDGKKKNLPKNRQLGEKLNLQSSGQNFTGNKLSTTNYDDESLLREPGEDDRDSGDDLCVKVRGNDDEKKEVNTEESNKPTEENLPEPTEERQQENNENNTNDINTQNTAAAVSFANYDFNSRSYLN